MDLVIYLAGAVVFFALVMASIALHEIGHLVPGKIFGVKTTQYFVGFGRTLWSKRVGETEYGFKAIPLGGYVRFVGMYPPNKQGQIRAARTGIFQTMADNARAAEWQDIRPEDEGRLFYQKRSWQKLIIMAGGPMMNILLAFLILLGVSLSYGVYRTQLQITQVQQCIVVQGSSTTDCNGKPPTPAAQSGIRPGDVVVAFNGQAVSSWNQVSVLIRDNMDRTAQLTVLRDGARVDLTPVQTVITGVPDRYDPSKRVAAGFFGVVPLQERERGGPIVVLGDMWQMTKQTAVALVDFPAKVFYTGYNLVTGKPRDIYGPMSILGASRAAGEIASTDKIQADDKLASGLTVLGSVNLFVALFNFIPLLPLDGGHIAGAIYEAVKRRAARLLRRPDPGFVDTAKMLPVAYVVGTVILLSGVVLILADIIDPIRLF
jgi:membrane-associated protease RseP (regulator of RpoE activity)